MVERLGRSATFWTYAAVCLITIVFVWRTVPETKRELLEQIRVRRA
jgi:predicted MFS family arabinose efflux permease